MTIYNDIDYIVLSAEILTPAFVSGADQGISDLMRTPSIKGLLMWWYRATVGHRYLDRIDNLRVEEGKIFGSSEMGIKSPIKIEAYSDGNIKEIERGSKPPHSGVEVGRYGMDVLNYLAYGPIRLLTRKEKEDPKLEPCFRDATGSKRGLLLIRPAVEKGTKFYIKVSMRKGVLTSSQKNDLVRSFASWLTLGGIGSRSRKGWGGLWGEIEEFSKGFGDAETWFRDQRGRLLSMKTVDYKPGFVPDFPVLEYAMRLKTGKTFDRWENALADIGKYYFYLRPKRDERWIGGDAQPRRASSIFLKVVKEGEKLKGIVFIFVCKRSMKIDGSRELESFLKRYSRKF